MSAPGQPAEGGATETGAAAETAAAPDYSAVMDRAEQIAGTVDGLRTEFQQFVQAQQPAPPEEPDPWDALFGVDPGPQQVDQFGNPVGGPQTQPAPQQFDPQAFQQAVQATAQQMIQQQVGPLQQTVQGLQQQAQLAQLYESVPQLAPKPENAEIRAQTAERVQQALNGAPPEVAAYLSNSPDFIHTIFKAAEAERLAQAQEPAGGPQVLEGSGATPGGSGDAWSLSSIMPNKVELPGGFR